MHNDIKANHSEILNKYIIGNSKDINLFFPEVDPFIDLIVTSPPYWDMKQYGDIDEQTGYGQSYETYLNDLRTTFDGIFNYSKENATLFLIVDTMKRNGKMIRLPDDISSVLEEIGWIHQDTIIWDKGKTLPWSRKGQMRNVFEYILMFTKKGAKDYKYNIDGIKTVDNLMEWWIDYPERYSPQGKVPDNIWEFFIPTQGSWGTKKDFGEDEFRHACPFPPDMMARIIKLSSEKGDVVFDPYAGTGVLLATAKLLDRQYLGFDTNPDYKKVFEKVTTPLVEERWPDIEFYYSQQEKLKELMKSTIYKLRALKYPKALIKRMRNILKSKSELKNQFELVIANEVELTEEDIQKKKIGNVYYTFVWNDEDSIEEAKNLIHTITSNAPFTKYGLTTHIDVISTKELLNDTRRFTEKYVSYIKGCTTSYENESITMTYYKRIMGTNQFREYFDKDIPPILSNIKIHKNDYNDLPAAKYQKR